MKKRKKSNRARSGFSLVELLAATLILLMVSSVVVGGIPVAKDAYEKVTITANAQVLLSTALTALRNQLGTASNVELVESADSYESGAVEALVYYNAAIETDSMIYLKNVDGDSPCIMVQDYIDREADGETDQNNLTSSRQLVTDAASDGDLYITYDDVSAEDGIVEFSKLAVYMEDETDARVSLDTYCVRVSADIP